MIGKRNYGHNVHYLNFVVLFRNDEFRKTNYLCSLSFHPKEFQT